MATYSDSAESLIFFGEPLQIPAAMLVPAGMINMATFSWSVPYQSPVVVDACSFRTHLFAITVLAHNAPGCSIL